MATYRIDRINKEFLRLISEMLQTRIKRAEAAEAVLTRVSVSRDLSYAKVFYTLIDQDGREKVQAVLDSAAGPLRSMLGKEMHLRTIPELHFCYDDSENKARAMDELLDRVAELEDVYKRQVIPSMPDAPPFLTTRLYASAMFALVRIHSSNVCALSSPAFSVWAILGAFMVLSASSLSSHEQPAWQFSAFFALPDLLSSEKFVTVRPFLMFFFFHQYYGLC